MLLHKYCFISITFILLLRINYSFHPITVSPFNVKNHPEMTKVFILLYRGTKVSSVHTSRDEGQDYYSIYAKAEARSSFRSKFEVEIGTCHQFFPPK